MYYKAFKYRLYPTREQARYIMQFAGNHGFSTIGGLQVKKDVWEKKTAYRFTMS